MCFTYCEAQVLLADFFYNFKGYQVREGKPVGKWSHCVQFLATERICSLLFSQIIPIHLSAFSMNVAAGFSMFFTGALNISKTTFSDIAS